MMESFEVDSSADGRGCRQRCESESLPLIRGFAVLGYQSGLPSRAATGPCRES